MCAVSLLSHVIDYHNWYDIMIALIDTLITMIMIPQSVTVIKFGVSGGFHVNTRRTLGEHQVDI